MSHYANVHKSRKRIDDQGLSSFLPMLLSSSYAAIYEKNEEGDMNEPYQAILALPSDPENRAPTNAVAFCYVCDEFGILNHFAAYSYDAGSRKVENLSMLLEPHSAEAASIGRRQTLGKNGAINTYQVDLASPTSPETKTVIIFERAAGDGSDSRVVQGAALFRLDQSEPAVLEYLARILLTKSHVVPWCLQAAAAESKITVDAVLNIFDSEFRYKPIIDMWDPRGREHFGRKLAFFIERNLALPFMLPGFPCKSPNAADKVLGHLPDKGEELALASMVTIGDLIREVYAPGAKFVIVSDGHVFSDLIGVPDANVNEYGATLRSQVVQSTGRPELFSFFDLRDMTFPDSNAPDRSVMESASRIESELPSQYAVSVEHHLQADTNPIADETRRLLCVLAGSSRSILRKDIASDHVTTALYRAFSRFLLDDLRHMPEMQALPSKSAQKKLCTKIAFEMMIRNQAYSALVELLFPLHLRISVHGHSCEGPKFGVRLIHRSFLAKDAFIPAFEGSTSLHIPTPWHNVVVMDRQGRCAIMARAEATRYANGEEPQVVHYDDGRPSHLLIDSLSSIQDATPTVEPSTATEIFRDAADVATEANIPQTLAPMGQSISEATVHISSVKADIVPLKDEKPPAPRPRPPTPSTTTAVEPYCAYSPTRRYCLLALVALAGALGPLAGNIYLPAMVPIGQSLNASASMINISVSIFMLMFAVAPLGWGSLADRTGRRAVYLISFAVYVAGSIALAFTNSYAYLIVFRLLQATGAASVQSLGGGTLVDLFKPTERGQAMGIFLLGPQLGPLIGPLIGGFLARYAGWKAIFWFLAGLGVALWVAIFFFLPETLRARAGNGKAYAERGWIVVPAPLMKPWDPSRARYNPLAPLKFLRFTSIVLCLSYIAILFGSFYCFNVSIPVILQNEYGYNEAQVGLSYIPVGLGFILGSNVAGRYADRTVKAALKRSEGQPVPETRVRCQWVGLVLFPFGVLLFGFAASFRWHVAVLFLTMFISVFGLTWTFSCNTTYLIDSFPGSAAGVVALNSLFRNPAAAVGSAVIEPFVDEVGYWKSFLTVSIIAWVAAGLVVTVMINGAKWRLAAKSKAPPASGSAESAPGPKRV